MEDYLELMFNLKEDGEDKLTVTVFWAFDTFCVTLVIQFRPYLGHLVDFKASFQYKHFINSTTMHRHEWNSEINTIN